MTPACRRSLALLNARLLALLAVAALAGCDDKASIQAKQDTAAFNAAVEKARALSELIRVDMKPVASRLATTPPAALAEALDQSRPRTMAELQTVNNLRDGYLAELEKVAADLEKIIKAGTPGQQASARALLAETYAAQSRKRHRAALDLWTQAYQESAAAFARLSAAEISISHAKRMQSNAQARAANQVAYQDKVKSELQALEAQEAQMAAKLEQLEKAEAQNRAINQQQTAISQKLRNDAVAKSGKEQFELYSQAIEAQQRSVKAATQAELAEAEIRSLKPQHQAVANRIQVLKGDIERTEGDVGETRKQGEVIDQERATAHKLRDENLAAMVKAFQDADVKLKAEEAAMKKAQEIMEKAIAQAQDAVQVTPSERPMAEASLLGYHVELVGQLADHAQALGLYGNGLAAVALHCNNLGLAEGDPFALRYRDAGAAQLDIAQRANDRHAKEIVPKLTQLASGTDDQKKLADTLSRSVGGAKDRIDGSRLNEKLAITKISSPTPRPSPAPQPAPGDGQPAGQPVAVGAIAPMPPFALGPGASGVILLDAAELAPDKVLAAAKDLLGDEVAQMLAPQLGMYGQLHSQFAQAGGAGVAMALRTPEKAGEEPEPIVMLSVPAAGEAQVKQLLAGLLGDNLSNATAERVGGWMTYRKPGTQLPAAGEDPARAALMNQAAASQGKAALVMAFVVSPELVQQSKAMRQKPGAPPVPPMLQAIEPLMEKAQWANLAIKLGDALGIYSKVRMGSEADAAQFKALLDDAVKQAMTPEPGEPAIGPQAMLRNAVKGALKIELAGDTVSISFSGPGLKVLGKMAGGMLPMLLGGGPGGPEGPGGPGLTPEPGLPPAPEK